MIKTGMEAWDNERISRKSIDPKTICTFGIKCLDDALFGILKKDFVVIGADSGVGKSEICLKIAMHNAKQGKKVAIYFLEGGDEEAIARIKWDLIRDRYYKHKGHGIDMDYRKWRMNLLDSAVMDSLEDEAGREIEQILTENIKIYGYERGLTLDSFVESLGYFLEPEEGYPDDLLSYKHNIDLIIIDHLQYFTLVNPKQELTEQTEILRKVNEITHGYKIPVVLISHLRKKDKDRGLPSQEDFYGTSNIAKMSSLAITMASGDPTDNGMQYPTLFRFVKTRTKISSTYAIKCNFNLHDGAYEKNYTVHKLKGDVPNEEALTIDKLPKWAQNASYKKPVEDDNIRDFYDQ